MVDEANLMKLYKECGDEIAARMATLNSVEYMQYLTDFPHLNMVALCRKLGLEYTRMAIENPK